MGPEEGRRRRQAGSRCRGCRSAAYSWPSALLPPRPAPPQAGRVRRSAGIERLTHARRLLGAAPALGALRRRRGLEGRAVVAYTSARRARRCRRRRSPSCRARSPAVAAVALERRCARRRAFDRSRGCTALSMPVDGRAAAARLDERLARRTTAPAGSRAGVVACARTAAPEGDKYQRARPRARGRRRRWSSLAMLRSRLEARLSLRILRAVEASPSRAPSRRADPPRSRGARLLALDGARAVGRRERVDGFRLTFACTARSEVLVVTLRARR